MGTHQVNVENRTYRMSKKNIEKATTIPIILGTSRIEMPPEVESNPIAKEKWKALSKIFHKTDYVTSADAELIAQLCLLYADVSDLRAILAELPPAGRLDVYPKIDSKTRLITAIGEKLFLNPLVRKRGLPPAPKVEEKGELAKGGFDI